MYKRILISAIAALCCLATLPCAAQVTIKFKSLKISNVTDKIWEPEKDLFCAFRLPSYDRGDVYLRIEAEIVNEGDTAVPIPSSDRDKMTLVYRNPNPKDNSLANSMVKSQLGAIVRVCGILEPNIPPHSRRYNDYVNWIYVHRFDGMRPLYYVSAAISHIISCHAGVLSSMAKCPACGTKYQLLHGASSASKYSRAISKGVVRSRSPMTQ